MKQGFANGRILGRDGDALRMMDRGVEFQVEISQLTRDAASHFEEAGRLMEQGFFHRAATQAGIARLLDPESPEFDRIRPALLEGLQREADDRKKMREERETEEAREQREAMLRLLASSHPDLHVALTLEEPPRPRARVEAAPDLGSWAPLSRLGGTVFAPLQVARRGQGSAGARLQTVERLAEPPNASIGERMARLTQPDNAAEAVIDLFLEATIGLWMDHLRFARFLEQRESEQENFKPPIEEARERARAMLDEQLLPVSEIEEIRVGNLIQQVERPVRQDPEARERLRPRLEAPFVQELRRGRGIAFITSFGDRVFVPVDDWRAFDSRAPLADVTDEEFLSKPREGFEAFRQAAGALCLGWASNLGDPLLSEAVMRLEAEAEALLEIPGQGAEAPAPGSAPDEAQEEASAEPPG